MLCLVNYCRTRQAGVLKLVYYSGLQPCLLSPTLSSVLLYSKSGCAPCPPTKGGGRRSTGCGVSGQKKGSANQVTYKPYTPKCYTDHDYKNMSLNRPMSPHLTIFRMPTTATMSIFQRATGVILAIYALLLAGGTLFLSNGVETYVSIIQSLDLGRITVMIIKIGLGFPFTYHYFNGIRFCMWNAGRWLDMKQVSSTASSSVVAAIVAALFFAFL